VQYHYIPWILEQEAGSEFESVHQRWRPRNLFLMRQVQLILKDMDSRQANLELARDELQSLEYAAKYIKYIRRMRIWVRDAGFAWKADQLRFLKSAAGFYSDYGAILRLLKMDQLRGKFTEPAVVNTTGV
jgi:hypothetical protein